MEMDGSDVGYGVDLTPWLPLGMTLISSVKTTIAVALTLSEEMIAMGDLSGPEEECDPLAQSSFTQDETAPGGELENIHLAKYQNRMANQACEI